MALIQGFARAMPASVWRRTEEHNRNTEAEVFQIQYLSGMDELILSFLSQFKG